MTNDERFQAIFQLYESEHGYAPCRTREVVEWAVGKNLLPMPPPVDPYEVLAGRMSKALAQEFETHEGRRYRVNHAVRATKNGKQQSFWAIMGFAPHAHMERAFAQRREHIVAECVQLDTDVAVYNTMNEGKHPEIQMILDFTEDVAERRQ
ncbi:MAG: hypothetical protein OXH75_15400 [Acidobacteria bacterium]|nr:hypothetical protein [Acidobacteriota bacterium]